MKFISKEGQRNGVDNNIGGKSKRFLKNRIWLFTISIYQGRKIQSWKKERE